MRKERMYMFAMTQQAMAESKAEILNGSRNAARTSNEQLHNRSTENEIFCSDQVEYTRPKPLGEAPPAVHWRT
jgi:hypothetical protein